MRCGENPDPTREHSRCGVSAQSYTNAGIANLLTPIYRCANIAKLVEPPTNDSLAARSASLRKAENENRVHREFRSLSPLIADGAKEKIGNLFR